MPESNSKILEVQELILHYYSKSGVVRALDGVTFSIEKGQALGIVGESGAGKSSLAISLMRLLPRNIALYSGSVKLDSVDCMGLTDLEFRRLIRWRRLAMVFQGAMESLNPVLRVGSQVAEPLIVHLKMKKDEANVEVARLFELVMLPRDVFNRYPHELSGGMKQRVVIAMALALHPDLVILDEPTSALDVSVQAQIMNLLKRLKWELGISFLFITHDIALASDLSDAIAVMYGGQILEIGSSEQILTKPVHPYTRLLLGSVPRLNSSIQPQFIPGMHPDMSTPLHGCRFISRCPYAYQRCRVESPNLFEVDSGQLGRCWLLEETSGNIEFAES